jgi:hypothetical protein
MRFYRLAHIAAIAKALRIVFEGNRGGTKVPSVRARLVSRDPSLKR